MKIVGGNWKKKCSEVIWIFIYYEYCKCKWSCVSWNEYDENCFNTYKPIKFVRLIFNQI